MTAVHVDRTPATIEQRADALRADLNKIAASFSVDIRLALVLSNKINTPTTLADECFDVFQSESPDLIALSCVPYSQDIRNAVEVRRTVFRLAGPSTTATRVREAFVEAAGHLVGRLATPAGSVDE